MHPSRLRWLILTFVVVFLDRASKAIIEAKTSEGWRHELVHHFIYLVHSRNTGIAFSLFADRPHSARRGHRFFRSLVWFLSLPGVQRRRLGDHHWRRPDPARRPATAPIDKTASN